MNDRSAVTEPFDYLVLDLSLASGVTLLDGFHRDFVLKINQGVANSLLAFTTVDIKEIWRDMTVVWATHCRVEEAYWREVGGKTKRDWSAHVEDHRRLTTSLRTLAEQALETREEIEQQWQEFTGKFLRHILVHDRPDAHFLGRLQADDNRDSDKPRESEDDMRWSLAAVESYVQLQARHGRNTISLARSNAARQTEVKGVVSPFVTAEKEFFRLVLESCGSPIVIADASAPDYPLVYVNQAFEKLTGYQRSEIIGRNCRFLHGSDRDQPDLAKIRQALREGGSTRAVLRNYRKDGTVFWNQLTLAPLSDTQGAVTHFLGVQNDVSQLKFLEEERLAAVSRLQGLLDILPTGVILVDRQTERFVYVNPRMHQMLRYAPGELQDRTMLDLDQAEDLRSVGEEFLSLLRGEKALAANQPFLRKDGTVIELDVSSIGLRYGGQDCLCATFVDVGERRQIEAALRTNMERLDAILKASPDITLIFDHEVRIVDCLPREDSRFFGPLDEFLGRSIREVMPPHVAKLAESNVKAVISNRQVTRIEYSLDHPNGVRHYEARFFPYGNHQVSAMVRDVSELKATEISLAASNAEFSTLFDTMAQGVVYQNANGEIIRANLAAQRLLGMSLDQMQGKTSLDPGWRAVREDGTEFPGDEHPGMLALRSGRQVDNVVMGVFHPGQEDYVWILISARPEYLPGEATPYRVYASFTDITERRRATRQIERQARIQELLLEISATFINLPEAQVESAINKALADLGRFFEADRMYIFDLDPGMTVTNNTHEWCAPGVTPQLELLQNFPMEGLDDWKRAFQQGLIFELEDVLALPPESKTRQMLEPQGIISILTVPLIDNGRCIGFAGLDFTRGVRRHSDAERRLMRVFAQSLVNVRDRLRIQKALTQSRGFLSDLMDNSGSLIYVKDRTGCYTMINRKFVEVTGKSREQSLGMHDEQLFAPEVAKQFTRHDRRVLKTGKPLRIQETLAGLQDQRYFLSVRFPTRDADGKITGLAGVSTEITELKRGEQLEARRNDVLLGLLAAEPMPKIYARLIEFVESTVTGAMCCILLADESKESLKVAAAPSLPDYYKAAIQEVPIDPGIHACGTAVYWGDIQTESGWTESLRALARRAGLEACWSEPIRSALGSILGSFTIYRAVQGLPSSGQRRLLVQAAALTALTVDQENARRDRQARTEAEAVNRAHQRFLARMSHEIRTPLNAILGFGYRLLNTEELSNDQARQLRSITQSGEHLLALLNDILDYSKIESGQSTLNVIDYSLDDLLAEVAAIYRNRAEAKGLHFSFLPDRHLPGWARGDALKLRQVLINLLSNAVKFTNTGGVVFRAGFGPKIDGSATTLLMSIEDTGPGIATEELPRLFDDFFQGEAGRAAGGTGLGLPISHNLIHSMGGAIEVQSRLGEGSCFHVQIPLEPVVDASKPGMLSPASEEPLPSPMPVSEPNLIPTRFATLPLPLQQAMRDALAAGQMKTMRRLLDEIPDGEAALISRLSALIEQYDYRSLRRLFDSTEQVS